MGGWGGPFGAAPGGGAAAGFACSAGDPVFCAKAAFAATPAATATVEPKKVRRSTDTMVTSSTFKHLASPNPKRGISSGKVQITARGGANSFWPSNMPTQLLWLEPSPSQSGPRPAGQVMRGGAYVCHPPSQGH